jgi:hypothetical protein
MSFNCPICDKQYPKLISLSVHFRKLHKGTSKKLYTLLYHNGIEPTCGCGCGGEVKYLDTTRGFREFIRGHAARVPGKNNWGNNKKAREASQKTRKEMWKKGELEIWNKGLTKEDHESVAEYGRKGSETISSNQEELQRRSKRMRKGRLDGTVPTLYGPDHSQYKDGTSSLQNYCHGNQRLHNKWKTPKIRAANYTCQHCNITYKRNQLHVHHDKERMCDIVRLIAARYNWTESIHSNGVAANINTLKSQISNAVADYHIKNNVSGVVLCVDCHSKVHGRPILGKGRHNV